MTGFSLKAALEALAPAAREQAEGRLTVLRDALVALGDYELRDDSRLAFSYATETGDAATMALEEVASDMAVAQYLYSQTDYRALWEADMKQVTGWLRATYPGVTWKTAWAIVRSTMDPCCKLEAVQRAEARA